MIEILMHFENFLESTGTHIPQSDKYKYFTEYAQVYKHLGEATNALMMTYLYGGSVQIESEDDISRVVLTCNRRGEEHTRVYSILSDIAFGIFQRKEGEYEGALEVSE